MVKFSSLKDKRERVRNFLDQSYEILKNGDQKNTLEVLQELKNNKLSTEYLTALKLSKVIEKQNGKIIWLQQKPTYKLTDMIISMASKIIEKRNINYRSKQIDNIFKFMRSLYRKIGKIPRSLDELNIVKILSDYELIPEYGEALIVKNFIGSHIIVKAGKTIKAYSWDGEKPTIESAEKIYNYVINSLQKAKKNTDKRNKKFIRDYSDFMNYVQKNKKNA